MPWPSVKCCRLVAPALPSGTSIPPRLSRVQQASGGGADELERDLDALGVLGRGADLLDLPRGELGRRRRVERQRVTAEVGIVPGESRRAPSQVRWAQ